MNFLNSAQQETEFLEISSIRDTRTGKYAKIPRNVCCTVSFKLSLFVHFVFLHLIDCITGRQTERINQHWSTRPYPWGENLDSSLWARLCQRELYQFLYIFQRHCSGKFRLATEFEANDWWWLIEGMDHRDTKDRIQSVSDQRFCLHVPGKSAHQIASDDRQRGTPAN